MAERKRRVTSRDVALRAGVSQSAVSRAFTRGSSISDATRRKVLHAASALNYVPNSIARSLITARSNIVAMVVGDLNNPFYSAVLDEFSQVLQAQGKHVLVFRVANGSEVDDALLEVLQFQVDGIIVTSAQVSSKMAGLCMDRGIPVVMFNRYVEGVKTDNVCCDNVAGGRMAARALLESGGTRFAMITGESDASTNRDRLEGFLAALEEAGIARGDVKIAAGDYTYEGGSAAASELFANRETAPDAVFCGNDIMALGAMDRLCDELQLRVPDEVMLIGFDDIPESARSPYRLTTIRQPREAMIEKAMELLEAAQENEKPAPGTHFLEGELIWRETLRELI